MAGGWVDRFFAAVDRLPGPTEGWFFGGGIFMSALAHALAWATGALPYGRIVIELTLPALADGYLLALIALQNRVARAAFEDFRPVLARPDEEASFSWRLTSFRDRSALLAMVLVFVLVSGLFAVFVSPTQVRQPGVVDPLMALFWIAFGALLGLAILHTIEQLRAVTEMSRAARNVDIFAPGPNASLARLTAVSAIALLLFATVLVASGQRQVLLTQVTEAGIAVVGILAFVLPLQVMHARLAREKAALEAGVQERLKAVLGRLKTSIDTDDMSRAEQLQKTLDAVLAERELVAKLSTWPWSPGTFRSVASAVLLPVVIFLITRALDRLV